MEYCNKKLNCCLFVLLLLLSACSDNVDIKDMFISPSSVNDRYKQSMAWNAEHPYKTIAVATEDYLIMNMSDSHVGATKNTHSFFDAAKKMNATAVVINGDFCTGHVADYNTFHSILPPSDSLPSFLTIGNHELYFDGWNEFYSRYGSSMYYFTVKTPTTKDLYICLDSGSGTLGSKQLAWLENLLTIERNNYRNCIIFTHVNLFRIRRTSSTNPNTEELAVLLDLFAINQVNMVITGHDHVAYVEKLGNTTHITTNALKDGEANAGFFNLIIGYNTINYTFTSL